jgi:hypothetical protein
MRRIAICLGIILVALLVASQFLLPPYLENRVADRITAHGGSATVGLAAFPALRLLTGHGRKLAIDARGLSVDPTQDQRDVFGQLNKFHDVHVFVADSRAGPLSVKRFTVTGNGDKTYAVTVVGTGNAADIARYAGSRLGGGLGGALAGLAATAIAGFVSEVPFNAKMRIDTSSGQPVASGVTGQVNGLPAGPLAQVIANALLSDL